MRATRVQFRYRIMPRRPLPDPTYCGTCGKVTNGAGYLGAMCQCGRAPVLAPAIGHSAGPSPAADDLPPHLEQDE